MDPNSKKQYRPVSAAEPHEKARVQPNEAPIAQRTVRSQWLPQPISIIISLASFFLLAFIAMSTLPASFLSIVSLASSQTATFCPTSYSIVSGIFASDDPQYVWSNATEAFGLLDQSELAWKKLHAQLKERNQGADALTAYKLLYVARHGEGFHNVGEARYGTHDWDCKWSSLDGDGEINWLDSHLTENGEREVGSVRHKVEKEVVRGMPLPRSLYSSPMRRARQTLHLTWLTSITATRPKIKESLRERLGVHTCDKRISRREIEEERPGWLLDPEFTQEDELWSPDWRESDDQHALRAQQFLNWLFTYDSAPVVSITAHSGTMSALFRAVGHRELAVGTAGFIPMIVKARGHLGGHKQSFAGSSSSPKPAC